MHFPRFFSGLLLATFSQALAQGAPVGQKTHILDVSNFETLTKTGTWIVKHFSPTCMHCLSFQPKWDKVISDSSLELFEKDVHFGEINCLENMELCQLNSVEGWPTVVAFESGKHTERLAGDKSEKKLREFVQQTVDRVTHAQRYLENSVVLDSTNFTQNIAEGLWLVKLYSPECPHCQTMAPEWTKMTNEMAGEMVKKGVVVLGQVDCLANLKVCADNHVDGYPTVNLFFNSAFIEEMRGPYTYKNMKEYVQKLEGRANAGEFDKAPEPPVNNDNRDWDEEDVKPAEKKAEEQKRVEEKEQKKGVEKTHKTPKDDADANAADSADSDAAVVNANEPAPQYNLDGEVVTLTRENFAERTASGPWFIKFYAPWCGHCQQLAPVWTKLAHETRGKVNIGEVNCDDAGTLCSKYNVQGYPSLKLIWEGEASDFKGSRDLDNMLAFVDGIMAQPRVLQSVDELRLAQTSLDVAYVFAYSSSDTSAKTKSALAHVKANAQKMFLSKQLNIVGDMSIAKAVISQDLSAPALVALKDGKVVRFEGSLTSDDQLREWFYAERFPLLPELSRENSDDLFFDTDYLVLVVLDTSKGADHTTEFREIARDAAIEYTRVHGASAGHTPKSSVRFAWVDGSKWASYIERVFRLTQKDWPAVVIAQPSEDRFFTTDVKGGVIEPSKMGIFLAVRAAVEGRLRAQSTNSIIVQVVRVAMGAVSATFALLFGTILRTLVTLGVVGAIGYGIYRRSSQGSRGGTYNIVKVE